MVQTEAQDSSESPPDNLEDAQEDNQEDGHDDGAEAPAKRQKRSRACQACRNMKIRCLPVEGQEACRACAKVNRACIMPGPARKRQKTVHKVAELEKKIDALTASLVAKQKQASEPTPPNDSPVTTSTPSSKRVDKEYNWNHIIERAYPDPYPDHHKDAEIDESVDDYEDVISRGLMDGVMATKIFEHWSNHMRPYYPVVSFPSHVTVDYLRRKKPMTLLAILVSGAGTIFPEIQAELAVEISRQLADRVMFYNEKSLDLVQAMLIYTSWYGKHKYAKDLGFNHYIHSAVAMCLDLGLGKRSRTSLHADPAEDVEVRRTWMSCYFMAGSVATVLRLPPLLKNSPYLEECVEKVSESPARLPGDDFLCCLVRLRHLVEDVGLVFQMDDPGSNIPINNTQTQYHLEIFERRLEEWKEQTSKYMPEVVMAQYEAVISLYIHEIALHNEHNIDDFRPMYRSTGRETAHATKDFLTNAHLNALAACVDAMQRAMQAFISMDQAVLRGVPSIHFVWTAYVAVAMIRLHGILIVPGSKYGSIFLPKLKINSMLDECITKLNLIATDGVHVPAEGFVIAFRKLKAWHLVRTTQQLRYGAGENYPSLEKDGNPPGRHKYLCISPEPGQSSSMKTETASNEDSDKTAAVNGSAKSKDSVFPPSQQEFQQQQQQQQPQQSTFASVNQQQFPQQQPQQALAGAGDSTLLDSNLPIDASTFDVPWDFSMGDMDNFENYLNDAGWMGYLM